ncbi:MAG: secretion protein, partial [Planctomycetales bacterium 12-60-4]
IGSGSYQMLSDLGLPDNVRQQLRQQLEETTGCLVFAGPAGSGKTTTAYACLREILHSQQSGKSIATLEDPVEAEIPGISQSQVHRPADFTYALGLRSLMRQDPDVILVGEIRDRETAETVFQASLTGHLVLTTLHAGSAAQGVTRLRDLGVEPYLLRAGLRGLLCQRLLRQRCACQHETAETTGCPDCWQTGYRGRFLISEFLVPQVLPESLAELGVIPAEQLQRRAAESGMVLMRQSAADAVAADRTTPAEVIRVLGSGAIPLN